MKLYIRQKVFSWTDQFTVKDEMGADRYTVEGEMFSLGKRLHIYDRSGTEVAAIRQVLLSFLPKYEVYTGDRLRAEIVKEFTLLKPRYTIGLLGWEIEGSYLFHDYSIRKNGRTIVTIHKEWMTWGDCYELDIEDPADTVTALAVVLTIDCVIAAADNTN